MSYLCLERAFKLPAGGRVFTETIPGKRKALLYLYVWLQMAVGGKQRRDQITHFIGDNWSSERESNVSKVTQLLPSR